MSEFKTGLRAASALGAAAAALIVASGLAFGQTRPVGSTSVLENLPRLWQRNFEYGVEIDGALSPDVGLYQLTGERLMLIFGPSLNAGFVLSFEPRAVRAVSSEEITVKSDLEVMLAEGSFSRSDPIPWLADESTAVIFYADQKKYRIARVPPIVGETTIEAVFEHDPMYRRGKEEYLPDDDEAITALQQVREAALIEVWFGTWCPHCKKIVPRLQKVIETTDNPNLEVLYHAVPRRFSDYEPAERRNVRGVPTLIFLRKGKEVGRIRGGAEKEPLETEMARILTSSARAGR